LRLLVLSLAILSEIGCARQYWYWSRPAPEKTMPPSTVPFELKIVAEPGGVQLYDCTYRARGKIARFRIRFEPWRPAASGEEPVAFAGGEFVAVRGSENSALLDDLKVVLSAKKMPSKTVRVARLPFDAVILATKQSRNAAGGFADRPTGDWVVTKLFLPKGGDRGEVYFDFNLRLGVGEFEEKYPEYGNYLVSQLAKVL
jgi:hypothetical protein